MQQIILKHINNPNISLFDENNFYNISFNDSIKGWLKFIINNNTINIYLTINNINGYVLFSKNIDNFNFDNLFFIVQEISGYFFENNFNYNKLLINFNFKINDLNDFEKNMQNANIFFIINNELNNIDKKDEILGLINIDKINKIKNENNNILNMDDLLIEIFKVIKPLNLSIDNLLSSDSFVLKLIKSLEK
jgi:hypothetical protein